MIKRMLGINRRRYGYPIMKDCVKVKIKQLLARTFVKVHRAENLSDNEKRER